MPRPDHTRKKLLRRVKRLEDRIERLEEQVEEDEEKEDTISDGGILRTEDNVW